MTNPQTIPRRTAVPTRRLLAMAVAGLVLVTGACSAGSETKADTKSEAGSGATSGATTKDRGASTTDEGADQVLSSTVAQLPSEANGATSVGIRLDVTRVRRLSGDTVQVRFTLTNTDKTTTFDPFKTFSGDLYDQNVGGLALLDRPNDKKYLPLYDTDKKCLCSDVDNLKLAPGATSGTLYVDVTAPPRSVKTVAVSMPGYAPIEDVELR